MRDAPARVLHLTDAGGIVLNACVFYPGRGGQPGDSGRLDWDGGDVQVVMAVKGEAGQVILLPAEPVALPGPGTPVLQPLDRAAAIGTCGFMVGCACCLS